MRTITVISTKGRQFTTYTTDVTKWGDLIPELINAGVYDRNMTAISTYSNDKLTNSSILPSEDFDVYLTVSTPKSGYDATTRQDIIEEIENILDTTPDGKADEIFFQYNDASTRELEEMLLNWESYTYEENNKKIAYIYEPTTEKISQLDRIEKLLNLIVSEIRATEKR